MMSKIEPMQPRSFLDTFQTRHMAPLPIDMPAKDEENLRDTSQGRTK
jgi:hypothetical protein